MPGDIDEAIASFYDENDRLLREFNMWPARQATRRRSTNTVRNADPANGEGGDYTQQTRQTVLQGTDTNPSTGTKLSEITYQYNLQGRMSEANVDSDGRRGHRQHHAIRVCGRRNAGERNGRWHEDALRC